MGRPRLPEKETGSHENFLPLKTWGEGKMDSFTLRTVYRVQPDEMINTCSCGYVIECMHEKWFEGRNEIVSVLHLSL